MYNTKFVFFLNLRFRIAIVRSAWRQPNISKHSLHQQFLWSGIKIFPKCALYDIVNGVNKLTLNKVNICAKNRPPVRKTGLGNMSWVKLQTLWLLRIIVNSNINANDGVLAWLSVWSEVQIVCTWSSWRHCIPKPHRLLPHLNPNWFYLSGTGLPRLSWKRGR